MERDKLQQLVGIYKDPRGRVIEAALSPEGLTVGERDTSPRCCSRARRTSSSHKCRRPGVVQRDASGAGTKVKLVIKGVDWRLSK